MRSTRDLLIAYFDPVRRNNVVVATGRPWIAAGASFALHVTAICECVQRGNLSSLPPADWADAEGRVVDDAGRPVPHARVELRTPVATYMDSAYTSVDGSFTAHLPIGKSATLTVSAPTFGKVERTIEGARQNAAIEIRLSPGTTAPASDIEILKRGCRCPDDLLVHRVR